MNRDQYTKTRTLNVKFEADKASLKQIEDNFKRLSSIKFLDKEQQEALKEQFTSVQKTKIEITNLKEAIEELSEFTGFEEVVEQLKDRLKELEQSQEEDTSMLEDIRKDFIEKTSSLAKGAAKKISDFVVDMFSNAIKMMSDMASYSLTSSKVFSSEAASLYTNYGLTGKEAYGLQKASQEMGFSSIDDLIDNMWLMNEAQIEEFEKDRKAYELSYENDLEIALAVQDFQEEWKDFQRDFQMEIIDFFMKNKDTIKTFMNVVMDVLSAILQVVGWIFNLFSPTNAKRTEYQRQQSTIDILGNPTTVNSYYKNTNVKIDNTYNGVGKTDQNWLANAGQMTYQQIINALN